jgi:uncharacterized protein (TIGR02421 family)
MPPRPSATHDSTALTVDAALYEISAAYDWLQALAPLNAERIWQDLCAGRTREPALEYAPLSLDTDRLRRELFAIPIERIGDPLLEELLREKQLEIERQITLLGLRGTPGFLQASLDLFGDADPELAAHAERILESTLASEGASNGERCIEAGELAALARTELAAYAATYPRFPSRVVIRADVTAGIMIANGEVRISRRVRVRESRVEALLHHEIGTHVLTYYNGLAQPIKQFSTGLAHYDALQEGLGVLAELVTGGLSAARLRTLAARVLAVRHLVEGDSFVATYRALIGERGLTKRGAFLTVLRAFRGGGLTKDVVYLRGLRALLAHLADHQDLETLYVGKFALRQLPAVRQLLARGAIEPARAMPRWLQSATDRARLERLRGATLTDLYSGGITLSEE